MHSCVMELVLLLGMSGLLVLLMYCRGKIIRSHTNYRLCIFKLSVLLSKIF